MWASIGRTLGNFETDEGYFSSEATGPIHTPMDEPLFAVCTF
jgi:hypothetical protein